MNTPDLIAQAPGKLILSGEHAILAGAPVIATAVSLYATTRVSPYSFSDVCFELINLSHKRDRTRRALQKLRSRLTMDYQRFRQGEIGIRSVLKTPFELMEHTVSHFLERVEEKRHRGVHIYHASDIPTGAGMGSSAATIISTQWALNAFYQKNLSKDALLSLAIESENLQHGRSSGIDLYLSTYGGCWLIDGIQKTPLSLEKLPLFWIHTGAPESTTGECVAHSQSCFQQDATLSAQFRAVTESMASAIETQDAPQFQTALQHNHELLCHLGVVPARIQAFLSQVHQAGAAGKICGAGSIRGESGGIVMVCGDRSLLEPLCHAQGWTLQPLIPTMQGVRILEK